MKISLIKHENVLPDGTFANERGAVEVKGKVIMSAGEGCGLDNCHCSDGHWITICLPRTEDGVVLGIKAKFDNGREMKKFLDEHELIGG